MVVLFYLFSPIFKMPSNYWNVIVTKEMKGRLNIGYTFCYSGFSPKCFLPVYLPMP
jgi:hypothetical protein